MLPLICLVVSANLLLSMLVSPSPCGFPVVVHDLLLQCELCQDALRDVAEQLLQEAGHIEKPAAAAPRTVTVYKPLPR